jgi:hypothetical protein
VGASWPKHARDLLPDTFNDSFAPASRPANKSLFLRTGKGPECTLGHTCRSALSRWCAVSLASPASLVLYRRLGQAEGCRGFWKATCCKKARHHVSITKSPVYQAFPATLDFFQDLDCIGSRPQEYLLEISKMKGMMQRFANLLKERTS